MGSGHLQIGEVAERTGLSLRTIRYYGEVGVVEPSARSRGGFRLYTEADVQRLRFVLRLKPLEFSLEELRELLGILDRLAESAGGGADRVRLLDRLRMYEQAAESRCAALREQLDMVEDVTGRLRGERARLEYPDSEEKNLR